MVHVLVAVICFVVGMLLKNEFVGFVVRFFRIALIFNFHLSPSCRIPHKLVMYFLEECVPKEAAKGRRESGRGACSDKQLLKLSLAERTVAETHVQKVWPNC